MTCSLTDQRVLIVGASSDIAAALAADLLREGTRVTLAGRVIERRPSRRRSSGTPPGLSPWTSQTRSRSRQPRIRSGPPAGFAAEGGNGPVASVAVKVIGLILLAKHFAPLIAEDGSLLFFSGLAAWRPSPEGVVMAVTNGSVRMLAAALRSYRRPRASAPSRPPSSPPSARDDMVPGKQQLFRRVEAAASARHVEDPAASQPPPAR